MVWRSIVTPLVALLVLAPACAGGALAQRPGDRDRGAQRGPGRGPERDRRGDWELLGSTRIGGFGVDHDVIRVGRRKGRFKKLGLQARKGSLLLLEVRVVYGNDEVQRFDLRQRLREGERTSPLDLQGRGRAIKRIEIAARARRGWRRRATVDVYGEKADSWELLGEQRVGRRTDHDTIRVGRREGRFAKIRLEVNGGDVQIRDFKVFFRHGPPQDVRVRKLIRAGGRTRPIDLHGGARVIDRIELVYRSRGHGRRARVAVYGLQGRRGGPPPRPPRPPRAEWEELGCQEVGFGVDRDVIDVGRREGRFSAIRLRVARSDVVILNLRVDYAHGPSDDLDLRGPIRAGAETRPLDLRGASRAIRRVELVYTSMPSPRGTASVCVDGRQ